MATAAAPERTPEPRVRSRRSSPGGAGTWARGLTLESEKTGPGDLTEKGPAEPGAPGRGASGSMHGGTARGHGAGLLATGVPVLPRRGPAASREAAAAGESAGRSRVRRRSGPPAGGAPRAGAGPGGGRRRPWRREAAGGGRRRRRELR